jgi:hypothetical protein
MFITSHLLPPDPPSRYYLIKPDGGSGRTARQPGFLIKNRNESEIFKWEIFKQMFGEERVKEERVARPWRIRYHGQNYHKGKGRWK